MPMKTSDSLEQKDLNKRGMLGSERESDRLFHTYPGPAWYRRTVSIPAEWKGKIPWLVFTGVHREAEVWVNGKSAGIHRSYLTPFRINLSQPPMSAQAGETITIAVRVDARRNREVDPLMGCLDTLDFLYVNWGGLYQPVRLEAATPTRLDDVFVVPRLENGTAEIRVAIAGPKSGNLKIVAEVHDAGRGIGQLGRSRCCRRRARDRADGLDRQARSCGRRNRPISTPRVSDSLQKAWHSTSARSGSACASSRSPAGSSCSTASRSSCAATATTAFSQTPSAPPVGQERVAAPGSRSPASTASTSYAIIAGRRRRTYLEAADELGMMLQPEFPFAYAGTSPRSPETRRAALEQWQAVIRLNRNHPSIVTLVHGERAVQFFRHRACDARGGTATRPDSTESSIPMVATSSTRLANLSTTWSSSSAKRIRSAIRTASTTSLPRSHKPVIGHEMGYFVTLPDLAQIDRFQGGLRPYWLQQDSRPGDQEWVAR